MDILCFWFLIIPIQLKKNLWNMTDLHLKNNKHFINNNHLIIAKEFLEDSRKTATASYER